MTDRPDNQAGSFKDSPLLKAGMFPIPKEHLYSSPSGRRYTVLAACRKVCAAPIGLLPTPAPALATPYGPGQEVPSRLDSMLGILLFFCALTLLIHVLRGFAAAIREWSRWRELPFCPKTSFGIENQILYRGSPRAIFEHCSRVCEELFPRFYAFHNFDGSAIVYHLFAKSGTLSLFALPWLKAGFLPLFVGCGFCFWTGSASPGLVLFWAGAALLFFFWLPSVWILASVPYQKIWMSLREADGRILLTLLCCSPSSWVRLNNLAKALVDRLLTLGPSKENDETSSFGLSARVVQVLHTAGPPPG